LKALQSEVRKIGEGDLRVRLEFHGDDEIGRFARLFQSTADILRGTMTSIRNSAGLVNDNAEQIAIQAAAQKDAHDQLSAVLSSAIASTEELSTSARQVFAQAKEIAQDASGAIAELTQGQSDIKTNLSLMVRVEEKVTQIASLILKLGDTVLKIGEITKAVQAIASKTDLLAINAAIEANTAGEQGKGFGVVALEIRKLSDESRTAMEDIGSLIGRIQEAFSETLRETEAGARFVRDSREWMEKTGTGMMKLLEATEKTNASIKTISGSTMEQSDVIMDLSKVMGMAEKEMAHTLEAVRTTLAAVENLRGQAGELEKLVGAYKVGNGNPPAAPAP